MIARVCGSGAPSYTEVTSPITEVSDVPTTLLRSEHVPADKGAIPKPNTSA